jgi:hypothetical protein
MRPPHYLRPLVSARHPTRRQQENPPPNPKQLKRSHPAYTTYHGCDARHCCTSTVVCKARCSRCSDEVRASGRWLVWERHSSARMGYVVLGWACVQYDRVHS